jgi:hypothetical protein
MIRWAKSVRLDVEHFSSAMYTKFLNTLVAAYYVYGVNGRPQAISKLTWKDYAEALKAGKAPASSHLKTAVKYGYQVSHLITEYICLISYFNIFFLPDHRYHWHSPNND